MKKFKNFSLLLVLFVLSSVLYGCPGGGGSSTLIDEMIEAYGGEEKLKLLDSYSVLWNMNAIAKSDTGKDVRHVKQPDKLRVELFYDSGNVELRILDGDQGISGIQGQGQQKAAPMQVNAMKIQRARLYTPLVLKSKAEGVTLSEEDGVKVLSIKEGDLVTKYYVNAQTKLIEKSVGILSMGGQSMEFITEYSDYREVKSASTPGVAGPIFAHKEVKYAMGMNTAVNTLMDIKFNEPHPDGRFSM